jgi:hypothetical protein
MILQEIGSKWHLAVSVAAMAGRSPIRAPALDRLKLITNIYKNIDLTINGCIPHQPAGKLILGLYLA